MYTEATQTYYELWIGMFKTLFSHQGVKAFDRSDKPGQSSNENGGKTIVQNEQYIYRLS